jgi:hypothetical protein
MAERVARSPSRDRSVEAVPSYGPRRPRTTRSGTPRVVWAGVDSASARRGVGSGGKAAGGDGNGSVGSGTKDVPFGIQGLRVAASIEGWVGCAGGGSGAIGSSGTAVRVEVASFVERPSSGPRAIAIVVEVLRMLGVSCRRIEAAAGGDSSTVPSVGANVTAVAPEGGDWVANVGRGPPAGLTAGGRSSG